MGLHQKRGLAPAALLALFVLLSTTACTVILGERGNGNVISEAREVTAFTGVDLAGQGRVEIEIGDTASLTIEAEENLMSLLTSDVSGGVLELGSTRNIDPTVEVVYHVTMTALDRVVVSGSGRIDAPDVTSESVSVDVSGSGAVYLDDAGLGALEVDVSGSGSVEVSGLADRIAVSISGSGSFDAEGLSAATAVVDISGSGSVVVDVSDLLEVEVSGSGSVEYLGTPVVESDISGSGSVHAR